MCGKCRGRDCVCNRRSDAGMVGRLLHSIELGCRWRFSLRVQFDLQCRRGALQPASKEANQFVRRVASGPYVLYGFTTNKASQLTIDAGAGGAAYEFADTDREHYFLAPTPYGPLGGIQLGDQYLGFKFVSGGTTLYGWALVNLTMSSITIDQWAYEDSGVGIHLGAIPEPRDSVARLAALALGAAGLRSWRRKKAVQ